MIRNQYAYYFITRVSMLFFLVVQNFVYCTILFAQLELANASGLALNAKPIPMI